MMKYYGVWEEGMDKQEFAETVAHLRYIREEEKKSSVAQLLTGRKK
jgi:hypothetical protein